MTWPAWHAWQHAILIGKLPVFGLGLCAVLYQLTRAPRNEGLRLVALCLMAALGSGVFELAWASRVVAAHTSLATAKLLQNLLLFALFFLLICFFLHAAGERRQIRTQTVIVTVAATALSAVLLWTPPTQRGAPYLESAHFSWVGSFYLVGLTYLAYATVTATRAAWRYSRLTELRVARGLRLIVAALVLAVTLPFERLAALISSVEGVALPDVVDHSAAGLQSLSIPIFVAGFILPSASSRLLASRRWWRHRREYHDLAPLWNTLHDVFPDDALIRGTGRIWLDAIAVRSVHRRCHRRAIECRDGLVRLSPYWQTPDQDEPIHVAGVNETSRNFDGHTTATDEQAARCLRASLQALRDGATPSHPAHLIMAPPTPDRDDDLAQLVALSRAWHRLNSGVSVAQ